MPGKERAKHKYYERVEIAPFQYQYFYSRDEYEAYMRGRQQKAKDKDAAAKQSQTAKANKTTTSKTAAAVSKTANTKVSTDGKTAKEYEKLADSIWRGNYGNGAKRKAKLEAEGYDFRSVQNMVNARMKGKPITQDMIDAANSKSSAANKAAAAASNKSTGKKSTGKKSSGGSSSKSSKSTATSGSSASSAIANDPAGYKELVADIKNGAYGKGSELKKNLTAAGYNYEEVQAIMKADSESDDLSGYEMVIALASTKSASKGQKAAYKEIDSLMQDFKKSVDKNWSKYRDGGKKIDYNSATAADEIAYQKVINGVTDKILASSSSKSSDQKTISKKQSQLQDALNKINTRYPDANDATQAERRSALISSAYEKYRDDLIWMYYQSKK